MLLKSLDRCEDVFCVLCFAIFNGNKVKSNVNRSKTRLSFFFRTKMNVLCAK